MVFVKETVTHLHHKWCVYSILPLALRAKQSALHIHIYDTVRKHLIGCHSNTNTVHWAVELSRFQLAAGGGKRSGPNMFLWLLFSFMLGLHRVGGKHNVV